jgi:hypothetical protein
LVASPLKDKSIVSQITNVSFMILECEMLID